MDSIRQKQVAELIRRQFSFVLVAEGQYIYGNAVLVTITSVTISPDFSLAKIYLSIFNTEDKQVILSKMEEHYPRLKQELHQRIKKQIRTMPELKFYLDELIDEVYKVDALFKKYEK